MQRTPQIPELPLTCISLHDGLYQVAKQAGEEDDDAQDGSRHRRGRPAREAVAQQRGADGAQQAAQRTLHRLLWAADEKGGSVSAPGR